MARARRVDVEATEATAMSASSAGETTQDTAPPLTVGALEVILLLLHPKTNIVLPVPVAQMRAAADAADQARAWAEHTLKQAVKG